MMTLGESLRAWREYRRYTVVEVATLSGVDKATIYRTEQGTHKSMLWPDLFKVATTLGIATIKQLQEGPGDG